MGGNYKSHMANPLLYYLTKNDTLTYQKLFCWVVGFAINCVCIFSYSLNVLSDPKADKSSRKLEASRVPDLIIFIASILFAVYSGLMFLLWLFIRAPKETKIEEIKYMLHNPFMDKNSIRTKLVVWLYHTLILERAALNFLCHCIFSILGILVDKVFLTLHLLLIININDTIRYVVRSTFEHIDQLLLTLLLAIFMIYSYAMINANYYSDRFDTTDVGDLDVCYTLLSCFLYVLNLGLRNGGGVADSQDLFDTKN